jgi:hypothetical protein
LPLHLRQRRSKETTILLSSLLLMGSMFKIGFVKMGNIASSLAVDLALDEIAERTDLEMRILSSGPKMTKKEAEASAELKGWGPQLVVIIGPNAATPGQTAAREQFKGLPTIVISDGPTKKEARDAMAAEGFGYIILPADPLIGAKREFLDPAEMAIFNADALKVLAVFLRSWPPQRGAQSAWSSAIPMRKPRPSEPSIWHRRWPASMPLPVSG